MTFLFLDFLNHILVIAQLFQVMIGDGLLKTTLQRIIDISMKIRMVKELPSYALNPHTKGNIGTPMT